MKKRPDSKTFSAHSNVALNTLAKPFILLENVTIKIRGITLFQNLTWLMGSGEHWAIVGPNGSGKSTLAQAIYRMIPYEEGRIVYYFDGQRLFFNPGEIVMISPLAHQELARRYSSYHQARWQSFEGTDAPLVVEFLSGKSIEHRSPYEVTPLITSETVYLERRTKAVQLLKIDHLLDRKITHLSHGETRKVMLARALMQAPKLLILDDPFGGLDQESRRILSSAIATLTASQAPQILMLTTNTQEIAPGITHLLLINEQGLVSATHVPINKQSRKVRFQTLMKPIQFFRQATKKPATDPAMGERPLQLPMILIWPTFSGEQVLVELNNISVSYGPVKVLRNLTWTVRQGERWALLGPNGAGKTTLLSLILADNPQAYSNHVKLFGKTRGSGESIWDIKRQIGWISPELQFFSYQNLTCYETVCTGFFDSLGLYQECSSDQADIADYWMRLFALSPIALRPFRTVSIGEQRLVLLARALVKSPQLLILDEPCHGLDLTHRRYILDLLDLLCRQTPVSIIYVTHYLDELPQGITHVLKLGQGQIVESGPWRVEPDHKKQGRGI